jgi:hypothetical protein
MMVTALLRILAWCKYMLVRPGGEGGESFKRIIVFHTVRHICWLGVGKSKHAAWVPPLTEHVFSAASQSHSSPLHHNISPTQPTSTLFSSGSTECTSQKLPGARSSERFSRAWTTAYVRSSVIRISASLIQMFCSACAWSWRSFMRLERQVTIKQFHANYMILNYDKNHAIKTLQLLLHGVWTNDLHSTSIHFLNSIFFWTSMIT